MIKAWAVMYEADSFFDNQSFEVCALFEVEADARNYIALRGSEIRNARIIELCEKSLLDEAREQIAMLKGGSDLLAQERDEAREEAQEFRDFVGSFHLFSWELERK